MGKFEEFKSIRTLSAQSQAISQVLLGEVNGEQAVLLMNKLAFGQEGVRVSKNQVLQENDIYTGGVLEIADTVKYTLIHPATARHVQKYAEGKRHTVYETAAHYREKILPLALKEGPSCQWVENIFRECAGQSAPHTTETNEKVLWIDPEFVILPDIKWDGKTASSLYLLVLFQDPALYTLRELRQAHLPLLERVRQRVQEVLGSYGVGMESVQLYFHYYPTFYRVHLHVSSLETFWFGTAIGGSVLLHDVVENLKLSANFYRERTMEVRLSTTSFLYPTYLDDQTAPA